MAAYRWWHALEGLMLDVLSSPVFIPHVWEAWKNVGNMVCLELSRCLQRALQEHISLWWDDNIGMGVANGMKPDARRVFTMVQYAFKIEAFRQKGCPMDTS